MLVDDKIRERSSEVLVHAHLSTIGDYQDLGFVNIKTTPGMAIEFQGFRIMSDLNVLEYRVKDAAGKWGGWVPEGEFVGSRGVADFLRGVAIRVKAGSIDQFSVRTTGLFKGVRNSVVGFDGEDVVGDADAPLYALQVDLVARDPSEIVSSSV